MSEMKTKCTEIADHYGPGIQLKKAVEELAELTGALVSDTATEFDIVSEMADVEIMLCQMRYLLGISDKKVLDEIVYKINRQLERIEEEKKNTEKLKEFIKEPTEVETFKAVFDCMWE